MHMGLVGSSPVRGDQVTHAGGIPWNNPGIITFYVAVVVIVMLIFIDNTFQNPVCLIYESRLP